MKFKSVVAPRLLVDLFFRFITSHNDIAKTDTFIVKQKLLLKEQLSVR